MAYENVKFVKPNMTIVNGYFYEMDESMDALVEKTAGGNIVNSYQLNTLLSRTIKDLHYDGANFWSLEDYGSPATGFVIRRWRKEYGSVLNLKDTFSYIDDTTYTYRSDAFGVEHYITEFTCTVSGGNDIICVNEFYDSTITSGTVLTLGPNSVEQLEDVIVSSVSGSNVTLSSGIQYTYDSGDQICFCKSLFVFNDYNYKSSASGTLFEFDSRDGSLIDLNFDIEYQNIDSAVFTRLVNVVPGNSNIHTLIYIKSTNAKLMNISDLSLYETASIDNLRTNGSTIIPVYSIDVYESDLYRLQDEATYFDTDNDWGSFYNYVVSPLRSFLDSITVTAYPVILPANGYNITQVNATVLDQYGEGVIYKPVFWTDTDSAGYTTINPSYTDVFFGTGNSVTYYRAGTEVHQVTIEGTATQYD